MMDELVEIQNWYLSQCDGDWEHQYGITIETLDNPGWLVRIDLVETNLVSKHFNPQKHGVGADSIDDSPDWYLCKVENYQFIGYGGPEHLKTILKIFLDWKNN